MSWYGLKIWSAAVENATSPPGRRTREPKSDAREDDGRAGVQWSTCLNMVFGACTTSPAP